MSHAARGSNESAGHGEAAWLSAYAIGLSSAGIDPQRMALRIRAATAATTTTYSDAMRRIRQLPGLEPRLRWTALLGLRIAQTEGPERAPTRTR